jgi:hypothetical protein
MTNPVRVVHLITTLAVGGAEQMLVKLLRAMDGSIEASATTTAALHSMSATADSSSYARERSHSWSCVTRKTFHALTASNPL